MAAEPGLDHFDDFDELSMSSVDPEYHFEKSKEELKDYIAKVEHDVRQGLNKNIDRLTPWFFSIMPRIYYETTPREEKVRHLAAIVSGNIFENKQTIELWDEDHQKVTYIGPGESRSVLIEMARKLAPQKIKLGSIYYSRDRSLFIASFSHRPYRQPDETNDHIRRKIADGQAAMHRLTPERSKEIAHYIENLDHDFIVYASPTRLQFTFNMLYHMLFHEGSYTTIEPVANAPAVRITAGFKGINIAEVLEHILYCIKRYGFEVVQSFSFEFKQGYIDPISVIHFVLRHPGSQEINMTQIPLKRLNKAMRTLGSVDSDNFNLLSQSPYDLSLNAANFIRSVASWVGILLGKENIYYYSSYKIERTFLTNPTLTTDLAALFRMKFSPLQDEETRQAEYQQIKTRLVDALQQLTDKIETHIFVESVRFVDNILKTNYFLHTKTGLAFRLDPEILDKKFYPQTPFGIFFITGRDFRFFHIRWRDVSRGGLRVVLPRNTTDYEFAMAGLFDEVYGLSHAQQLKNKDIPEGGSKGVMVVRPEGTKNKAVKSAINALLDLLVSEDESHEESFSRQVSYYKAEEILYLGPDENLTNDLIAWVPEQAHRRGYKYANAFMSSKMGSGINHKEYGVTSEGVQVYVEHTLRFIGIDPHKDKFTVKMTGGPDGDVAGNELKILHREYGENACIVAIADGFGAAYDPMGLNWPELLRLVKEGLPISEFNPKLLNETSPFDSFVIKANSNENIARRNRLHTQAYADIFIPAGGRPYTVNENNCKNFVDGNGTPTCKAIVEGANIFFTSGAREKLEELGVVMIKDSTANKTGVICSSFEIIASLILEPEEFIQIKDQYVGEVITILREKAALEAKLLLREYLKNQKQIKLVQISMDISREINIVTDAFSESFMPERKRILADENFQNIVLNHCPPILRKKYGDRILSRLPNNYKIAIIAANIASRIVYEEGLSWLNPYPAERRLEVAMTFLERSRRCEELIQTISGSSLPEKDEIIAILAKSGTRELAHIALDKSSNLALH